MSPLALRILPVETAYKLVCAPGHHDIPHLVDADRALPRSSLLIPHFWHECPWTRAASQSFREPVTFVQASAGGSAGKSDLALNVSLSESTVVGARLSKLR
eukprot:6190028-Pleurochrysis_carterae.AAC.2